MRIRGVGALALGCVVACGAEEPEVARGAPAPLAEPRARAQLPKPVHDTECEVEDGSKGPVVTWKDKAVRVPLPDARWRWSCKHGLLGEGRYEGLKLEVEVNHEEVADYGTSTPQHYVRNVEGEWKLDMKTGFVWQEPPLTTVGSDRREASCVDGPGKVDDAPHHFYTCASTLVRDGKMTTVVISAVAREAASGEQVQALVDDVITGWTLLPS